MIKRKPISKYYVYNISLSMLTNLYIMHDFTFCLFIASVIMPQMAAGLNLFNPMLARNIIFITLEVFKREWQSPSS